MSRRTIILSPAVIKSPNRSHSRLISEDNSRLISYLAELAETSGSFDVVAQRVEWQRLCEDYAWEELPITGVTVNEDARRICLMSLNKEAGGGVALSVESLLFALRTQVGHHPDFTIVIPVWIRIDEEHAERIDMPLDHIEVDEAVGVLRLRF